MVVPRVRMYDEPMSAAHQPITLDEFLAWERAQPERYEFDGTQPVAMTGGSVRHARIVSRTLIALGTRVAAPCEAFGAELKVITAGRVRYPDVSIVCNGSDGDDDLMTPTVVLEVLSPSTALTDRRVKAVEYAALPSILVYCLLEQDRPSVTVRRRSSNWEQELVEGEDAVLALPEVGISVVLGAIYG